MAKDNLKTDSKSLFWRNRKSKNLWKAEPFYVYKITNITTGSVYYADKRDINKHWLNKKYSEELDSKAAEVLFGTGQKE